ncbi:Predicted xylanase/chitin deacetylase [Aquiflexum balticum DSM 16537]|uniref:Predicted xylanase/chitin deacetylase n=1 Tax=Aquiflexum balticum DSM 16537 TaxID=758820 RepID=A0A1W2HBR1_9BACT|nr:polysaccharide deacetylase family protein [Aquiflexum balticum]SMD46046.1 Predicted xylanase/chitin deacetylase [Aquiflexum balticum DSM 16537]
MKKAIFTISLDFELHWGRFDKYPLEESLNYYKETRKVIPYILELFEKYGIEATWATVGSLMAENMEEWQHYCPKEQPTYGNKKYSPYEWIQREKFVPAEALFAPELVREVIACPGQEIGSHTFAHYYTCEKGQLSEQFRADLRASQKLAKEKFQLDLQSLVFPRNQYNDEVIQVAYQEGFDFIRSNPSDWFWKRTENSGLLKRFFRTGDTIIGLGKMSHYPMPEMEEGKPMLLPSSRLLRPYRGDGLFHQRRLKRIKDEMASAAQAGHVYHLWWHPHNFGLYPQENLHYTEGLFQFFNSLQDSYGMRSLNMKNATIKVV